MVLSWDYIEFRYRRPRVILIACQAYESSLHYISLSKTIMQAKQCPIQYDSWSSLYCMAYTNVHM